MHRQVVILAGALGLALTATFADAADVTGRVVRVDPGTQIIILDNNQAFRVTPNTVLTIENQPVTLSAVQPGHVVVLRAAEAVALAPVAPAPGNTVVVNPAPPPAPAASVATAAPATFPRQTVFGRVTDVDKEEVKIKTDTDSFEVRLPREVAAQVRQGDSVRVDLTFHR